MSILCAIDCTEEFKNKLDSIVQGIIYKPKNAITKEDLTGVEIVIGCVPSALLKDAKDLKLVLLDIAGCEPYCKDLNEDVLLCNASGAFGVEISEYMVGCTIMMEKNLFAYSKLQKEREWNYIGATKSMDELKVLVIGMGDIGSEYAKRMHSLGCTIYGVRRTIHDKPDYVEELYTMETMDAILPECDVIALSLPSTPETQHFMNDSRLSRMKDDSVIVNVGRGSAIDEISLLKHLRNGKFKGVCLDVTEQEPLPKNNPLWTEDRVLITPHISGRFSMTNTYNKTTYKKALKIISENLQNYLEGKPLVTLVNKKLGY